MAEGRRGSWFRRNLKTLAAAVLVMHAVGTAGALEHYSTTAHVVCADHGLAMDVPLSHAGADAPTLPTVRDVSADAQLLGHEHCATAALASIQLVAPANAVHPDGIALEALRQERRGHGQAQGGPSALALAPKVSPPA